MLWQNVSSRREHFIKINSLVQEQNIANSRERVGVHVPCSRWEEGKLGNGIGGGGVKNASFSSF
jgi:hypothetical protein